MGKRSTPLRFAYASRALACAFACLSAFACAGETRERPPDRVTHTAPRSPLPPLPMPSTAFQGDGPPPAPSAGRSEPPQSRFETRRIGANEGEGRPRYRGARVDLDLKNAELSEVFRLLSEVGHVNIVVAGEVTGTITMRLKQVPWDQALEVVARAKNLALDYDANVIIVHAAGK